MRTKTRSAPAQRTWPELPEQLAGWRWGAHTTTGEMKLTNPAGDWSTKWYFKPDRAVAEALRRMISEPAALQHQADTLTAPETERLQALEGVIARGVQTFIEVGEALSEIREKRLYRSQGATFEEYCRERWGIGASRARQLIGGAETARELESVTAVTPASERSMRPLAGLDTEQRRQVYQVAVEAAGGQPPTEQQVAAAAAPLKQPPALEPLPTDFADWQGRVALLGQGYRLSHDGSEFIIERGALSPLNIAAWSKVTLWVVTTEDGMHDQRAASAIDQALSMGDTQAAYGYARSIKNPTLKLQMFGRVDAYLDRVAARNQPPAKNTSAPTPPATTPAPTQPVAGFKPPTWMTSATIMQVNAQATKAPITSAQAGLTYTAHLLRIAGHPSLLPLIAEIESDLLDVEQSILERSRQITGERLQALLTQIQEAADVLPDAFYESYAMRIAAAKAAL